MEIDQLIIMWHKHKAFSLVKIFLYMSNGWQIICPKCTYIIGQRCSDFGMGGWVWRNLNIVQILKIRTYFWTLPILSSDDFYTPPKMGGWAVPASLDSDSNSDFRSIFWLRFQLRLQLTQKIDSGSDSSYSYSGSDSDPSYLDLESHIQTAN